MNISKLPDGVSGLSKEDNSHKVEQENMRVHSVKIKKTAVVEAQEAAPRDVISVSDIWRNMAQTINVRDASPTEMIILSGKLYAAGAISYDDHLNLSFQPEINLDSPAQSKAFSHEKKDYVDLWKSKQDNVIRNGGDRHQIEDTHRVHAILTYLDSLR